MLLSIYLYIVEFFYRKSFGKPRIKPGMAGWEAQVLLLCYAVPLEGFFVAGIERRFFQTASDHSIHHTMAPGPQQCSCFKTVPLIFSATTARSWWSTRTSASTSSPTTRRWSLVRTAGRRRRTSPRPWQPTSGPTRLRQLGSRATW